MCTVFRVSGPGIRSSTKPISDLDAEAIDFLKLGCPLEDAVSTELDCRKLADSRRSTFPTAPHDLTIGEVSDYIEAQLMSGEGGAEAG